MLANREQFACLVQAYYPRTQGLYGNRATPVVLLTVDPSGRVVDASILTTSGLSSLDEAALQVGRSLRYIPGQIRRRAVWTQFAVGVPMSPPANVPGSGPGWSRGAC